MAGRKKTANEIKNENGVVMQEAPTYQRPEPKIHNDKKWQDMPNAEREESLRQSDRNLVGQHAKAMKERRETAYYMKNASKEELEATLPYNPRTGQPFNGWLEEKMRMHQQLNNLKEAKYMTLDQAHANGMKLPPLKDENGEILKNKNTGADMYPIGVKFGYVKEYEKVPLKDKDGNIIYQKDENGKDITWTDSKGIEHKNPVMQTIKLEQPKIETITYYNVEQLDRSNQKYIDKPLDLTKRHEFQKGLEERGQEVQSNLSQFKLLPLTQKNLEKHMDASTMGRYLKAYLIIKNKGKSNG